MQAVADNIISQEYTEPEIITQIKQTLAADKTLSVDDDVQDDDGETSTLLHIACRYVLPGVVRDLLFRRADPYKVDSADQVPLMTLCNGCSSLDDAAGATIVEDLLIAGFEIDITQENPVYFAARYNTPLIVAKLIEREPGCANSGFTNGGSPLCLAAQCGSLEVCKVLLGAGANVDGESETGDRIRTDNKTPLMLASESEWLEIVELLLERGADAFKVDLLENNALHFAARNGNVAIARLLLDKARLSEKLEDLMNLENYDGMTPLDQHLLTASSSTAFMIELLLDNGAKWDMDWLIRKKNEGMIKNVLAHPNTIVDSHELTYAIHFNLPEIVRFILNDLPKVVLKKEKLEVLISKSTTSDEIKKLLRERIENQDEDGKLKKEDQLAEVKVEVENHEEENSRRRNRQDDEEEIKEEEKKPKNSADASTKNTKK